jgi:hypothetical protein
MLLNIVSYICRNICHIYEQINKSILKICYLTYKFICMWYKNGLTLQPLS